MRGFELLEKMGHIDPKYIEAADKTPIRRVSTWLKLGAVAACIALIVSAFVKLPQKQPQKVLPDLPTVNHSINYTGAGSEGYSAYDISQVTNGNPWYDSSELKTLPVYDNPLTANGAGVAWGADLAKLKAVALDMAARLGIETPTIEYIDYHGNPVPADNAGPTRIIIEKENICIDVDQTMSTRIDFEPAIPLPEEYNPSHNMSYDEAFAIAEYLRTEYSDLIGMDDPQISVEGNYNFFGEPNYQIYFYDGSDDLLEEIINYNFKKIKFWCSGDGLSTVIAEQPDLSHKIADYPIISAAEAQKALLNGYYATSCGYEFPGKKYVRKVELVYRNSVFDDYYIPYYRFYVENPNVRLTEQSDQNIRIYSTYYVPAVDRSYIGNMPTYDGRFN